MILFEKFSSEGYPCPATPVYNGYYNDNIFKMCFKDKIWFDAEVRGIELLSGKSYVPEILDIDYDNYIIQFKWYNTSINHLLHLNKTLPEDYVDQIKTILKDLEDNNIYKINFYPHTFYLKDSKVHIMDLYACIPADESVLEKDIGSIVNDDKRFKFVDGVLDLEHTYNYTLQNNVGKWPERITDD